MDGYTATRAIREKEELSSGAHRLPIVALTAHVTVDDKRKCLESGMDDYLGKPFTSEQLRKKLYKWLQPLLSDQLQRTTVVTSSSFDDNHTDSLSTKHEEQIENAKLLHDLKNMLLAIYGSAELALVDTKNSESVRQHMERIHSATQKANHIVETLASNCTEKR
jgi:CheY-like chemotaxis protein